MATQEQLNKLRTLTQQNGALIAQNGKLLDIVENGTGGGSSELLEEFWHVVPDDSEEIITDNEVLAEVEDIWNTTFNS